MEKPDGNVMLKNYSRFDSDYNDKISQAVKPSDYNPSGKGQNLMRKLVLFIITEGYDYSHQPELFKFTKAGKL